MILERIFCQIHNLRHVHIRILSKILLVRLCNHPDTNILLDDQMSCKEHFYRKRLPLSMDLCTVHLHIFYQVDNRNRFGIQQHRHHVDTIALTDMNQDYSLFDIFHLSIFDRISIDYHCCKCLHNTFLIHHIDMKDCISEEVEYKRLRHFLGNHLGSYIERHDLLQNILHRFHIDQKSYMDLNTQDCG